MREKSGQVSTAGAPLAVVLERIAGELEALSQASRGAELVLSRVIRSCEHTLSQEDVRGLQDMDQMSQTLDALSRFVRDFNPRSEHVTPFELSEATRGILLEGLAQRLRQGGRPETAMPKSGDAEMF